MKVIRLLNKNHQAPLKKCQFKHLEMDVRKSDLGDRLNLRL